MSQDTLLEYITQLAKEAGDVLLEWWDKELTHDIKTSEDDFATEADLAAEKVVLESLRTNFPNDRIIAEESGVFGPEDAEYTWTIDPLDGTLNYSKHIPAFGPMIARMKGDRVVAAVIFNPKTNELATGTIEGGAFFNGEPLKLPDNTGVDGNAGVVAMYQDETKEFKQLHALKGALEERDSDSQSKGSASQNLIEVFAGRRHYYVMNFGSSWDIAPVVGLLRMAGWNCVGPDGEDGFWHEGGRIKIMASSTASKQIREMLKS